MREVVAIVPLVLGLVVSSASAAPARYCNLLVDDGKELPEEQYARGSASDVTLVGGDIATDARNITVAIRLRALPDAPTHAASGARYQFAFSTSRAHHYVFEARLGQRQTFDLYARQAPGSDENATHLGSVTGVVDTAKDEVRMTAPVGLLGRLRPGTRINRLGASSMRTHADLDTPPPAGLVLAYQADALSGGDKVAYPAGAPSCVVVGR